MSRFGYNERGEPNGCTESRMVHFVLERGPRVGRHVAAVITDVWIDKSGVKTGFVGLTLFPAGRDGIMETQIPSAAYDPTGSQPGTWHHVERVD